MPVFQAQAMWHTIANENRDRVAVDDAHSSRSNVNEEIELNLLSNFFNHKDYTAPHAVNLASYARGIIVDPSQPPAVPKSLAWFRDQRRFLKVVMGGIKSAVVHKTGDGEYGVGGTDADTRFWKYCRGDLVVMFMWLHWGRGQNVPAHCSALLAEDCILDVGVGACGASSRSTVTSPSTDINIERALNQTEKLTQLLLSQATATVNVEAAESEHKMRLVTNLAARIQAYISVQKTAEGENIDKIRQKIADLTSQLLQVE